VCEAGNDFPERPQAGEEQRYYTRLRELLANSIDVATGRYGALIVDEAQDMHPDW
jgi:hypothetical protein